MEDDKIFTNAAQRVWLIDGNSETQCLTLQEAVIAWRHLPEDRRAAASIRTRDGSLYSALEIDRLYKKSNATPDGT